MKKVKLFYFTAFLLTVTQNLNAIYLGYVDEIDNNGTLRRVFVDFSLEKSTHVLKRQVIVDQVSKNAKETEEISKILYTTVRESLNSNDQNISQVTINFVNISHQDHFDIIDEISNSLVSKKSTESYLKGIKLSAFADDHASESIKISAHTKNNDITSRLD